jgi:MFS family permease
VAGSVRRQLTASADAFRQAFGNANLRRLQLALAGSLIGSWSYGVALIVYTFDAYGAAGVGVMAVIRYVPAAIAQPFTALLGDRFPRLRVMIGSDLLSAALMFAIAAAAATDAAPWIIFTLATFAGITGTAFRPAQAALLPSLVRTPEELTAANVVSSSIDSISVFVGPALGGLLLAVTGVDVVFAVNGVTFLWSAALVSRISAPDAPPEAEAVERDRHMLAELLAGFHVVARHRAVRVVVMMISAQTFVYGALTVLTAVLALDVLDMGASGVGLLNSAVGVGGIVGTVLAFSFAARARLGLIFAAGTALWGIPLAVIGAVPGTAGALILFGLLGAANTLVDVAGYTLLQRAADDAVRARVFGVLEMLMIVTIGVGALVAPLLVEVIGARGALVVFGLLLPVFVALSWGGVTYLDRTLDTAPRDTSLLRGIPLFAPLGEPAVERLAGSLRPVHVDAGETIFRQGDDGDLFYLVRSGEVEVSVDGTEPRVLGPGDFFGEIALLRSVPRTATVLARTDVELDALDREPFLETVTGHGGSAEAAETIVAARLGSGAGMPGTAPL